MAKYCAPGKGDSISCFSLSSLEKIINEWNLCRTILIRLNYQKTNEFYGHV